MCIARIAADDHVRRERWLDEIEAQWGPAPGRQLSDGASIFVLGERFGNVFVGIQPGFGYEGDPMRLLFEKRLRADARLLGLLPLAARGFRRRTRCCISARTARSSSCRASRAGLSARCWPDRLIGDLPNIYLYAANNPSEGAIAKRRSAATLVSYLTPPVAACRALSRAAGAEGARSSAGAARARARRRARRARRADPGAGRRARPRAGRAGLDG
jgi:magnesium chelatase subunit H